MDHAPLDSGFYRSHLLDEVIPFWYRHAIDEKSGGLFTCLADDGRRISGDKYLWSQCRAIWTFSALYNHVERRACHLEAAENIAQFVLKHGRDDSGRYLYRVAEDGGRLDGPISVYADFFAAYGMAELYRASRNSEYLVEALRTLRQAVARMSVVGFNEFAPYSRPEGVEFIHGSAMILLETAQELRLSVPDDPEIRGWCETAARTIMDIHVQKGRNILLEHLGPDGMPLDTPAGTAVNPGHTIESMWFVAHHALRNGDRKMANNAFQVMRKHLELGWDETFGGLYLAIDASGGPAWWPHAEKKIWWPHTEALYALYLAGAVTGESWCEEWLDRIARYSFARFPNVRDGEWHQKLNREGRPITGIIALPVKDPFHLPRALIRIIQLLDHGVSAAASQCANRQTLHTA